MEFDFESTYTLAEISRKLNRPRTTLKDWSELFREFLPTVGQGRTMRYKKSAIEVFSVISNMKDSGQPNELIRDVLRGLVNEITVTVDDDEPKPFMMQLMESYNVVVSELQRQNGLRDRQYRELLERFESVRKEITATREENNMLKQLMKQNNEMISEVSETLSRLEKHKKKSFFGRIFG